MDETLSAQWARIRGRLRAEYGEAAYRSWLKPLTLQGLDESRVRIAVPTRFMRRSEEHTSELQSLMRISYAVFCLKKKKTYIQYAQKRQINYQMHVQDKC